VKKLASQWGAVGSLYFMQDQRGHSCSDITLSDGFNIKSMSFYDISTWRESIRGLDFVLGPRVHGSMIALSVEVLAITIAIDMRIQEMCEFMRLASSGIDKISGDMEPEEVRTKLIEISRTLDGNAFDQRRRDLARNYSTIFHQYGIEPHPMLNDLSDD
jgi:hypothetical protein